MILGDGTGNPPMEKIIFNGVDFYYGRSRFLAWQPMVLCLTTTSMQLKLEVAVDDPDPFYGVVTM